MGKILDDPPFPVIERAPGFWRTGALVLGCHLFRWCKPHRFLTPLRPFGCCAVGNFNLTDWGVFGGLSAISYPLGYAAGASPSPAFAKVSGNMARPSAGMATILGAMAGFMLAYQNSSGRLMGFKPNDAEVKASKR